MTMDVTRSMTMPVVIIDICIIIGIVIMISTNIVIAARRH